MSELLRLCRTHGHEPSELATPNWCGTVIEAPQRDCDIVEMVWSSGGSALLAITECAECGGLGVVADGGGGGEHCECCRGQGRTYQAETRDGYDGSYRTIRVAVVPL